MGIRSFVPRLNRLAASEVILFITPIATVHYVPCKLAEADGALPSLD